VVEDVFDPFDESGIDSAQVTHLTDDVAVCLYGGPALSADGQAMLHAANIAVWPRPIARLEADGD
jgi:hypothetical protein